MQEKEREPLIIFNLIFLKNKKSFILSVQTSTPGIQYEYAFFFSSLFFFLKLTGNVLCYRYRFRMHRFLQFYKVPRCQGPDSCTVSDSMSSWLLWMDGWGNTLQYALTYKKYNNMSWKLDLWTLMITMGDDDHHLHLHPAQSHLRVHTLITSCFVFPFFLLTLLPFRLLLPYRTVVLQGGYI